MAAAVPPIDGYGELARQCLAHSEWPADTQPQPRSLAALFSKLDRGIELEWLADRDAVQRTLALVLRSPLESVRQALTPLRNPEATANRVRFDDLPFARPLDLVEESLPPGIPAEVTRPSSWRRLWWRAPSGSGRSLAGHWLRARGLAEFRCARVGAELELPLTAPGPVFVELERADGTEALHGALARDGICVAAPAAPAPERADDPASRGASPWIVVESPPASAIAAPLLDWMEARLPADGAFEARAARAWLQEPLRAGLLPTLGALLGAAGLLDAHSVRAAAQKSLRDLAAGFVHQRLEEASAKGSAEAQWLKRHGFEVVIKLAEAVLTGDDQPWEQSRSEDEWIELIPKEFRQSIDTEWVRWSLARAGGRSTVRDVERALRQVPPGAYRLVRALVDARLLGSRGAGLGLGIQPEFLKHVALVLARERLLSEASPFGWGEALLRPHAAPSVLEALYERLADGGAPLIDSLLELDLSSQPALMAAAEATFLCAGLRLLAGVELAPDQLRSLWNEQLGWVVELPGELPRPRVLCFEARPGARPLASLGLWCLAALAISEVLAAQQGAEHPILRPWTARAPSAELGRVLDLIFEELLAPEVSTRDFAVPAFALAGRLLRARPDVGVVAPSALARPSVLVRAARDGRLGDDALYGFAVHPIELAALQAECAREDMPWPRMAHALWQAFHESSCPAQSERLFTPGGFAARELWAHLPGGVLDAMWDRWTPLAGAWPYASFGRPQWLAFVTTWSRRWQGAPSGTWTAAFEAMDLEWAQRALRDGDVLHVTEGGAPSSSTAPSTTSPARAVLRVVWRRFPEWATTLLLEKIAQGDAVAIRSLLDSFPEPVPGRGSLVSTLSEALSRRDAPAPALDEGRRWLHSRVTARTADWRDAHQLLGELERRRARARRARGD